MQIVSLIVTIDQMMHQRHNILGSLPHRRNLNFKYIQAIIQVVTKLFVS